jgi:hypothetical protein
VAFVAAFLLTWRSAVHGIGVVLTVGYFYGIIRANWPDTASHFMFDAAVLGFLLTYFATGGLKAFRDPNQLDLQRWSFVLIGWPILMFLLPIQDPIIQLVGLRGNIFLLPFMLIGARLTRDEANGVAMWLCLLNHVTFVFAIAEYFMGVPAFFPENQVTELIYRSRDVAGGGGALLRIPATFSNSHSYGGTMVATIPWLLGAWIQARLVDWQRLLLLSGTAVAMVGVFLCAARTPLILLAVVVGTATFSGHLRGTVWLVWGLLILGVAWLVSSDDRMQRFTSLQDTEHVIERIEGSVNKNFLELLVTYPFSNGLGAGGTSIPHFLQDRVRNPVAMENEYSRILLEQGLAGLFIWVAFIIWFLGRRPMDSRDSWQFGKTILWMFTLGSFAMAVTGIGLMTAIPLSMMFFLGIGFVTAPPVLVRRVRSKSKPVLAAGAHAHAIAPSSNLGGS